MPPQASANQGWTANFTPKLLRYRQNAQAYDEAKCAVREQRNALIKPGKTLKQECSWIALSGFSSGHVTEFYS